MADPGIPRSGPDHRGAALGVISAGPWWNAANRLGYSEPSASSAGWVQLSFLLESSFITGTAILLGTTLGLTVAYNVISDSARQPSWENLKFSPPWLLLSGILLVVFIASLAPPWARPTRLPRLPSRSSALRVAATLPPGGYE